MKNWIVLFAACAQQGTELAFLFSACSFESSVEHYHFDDISSFRLITSVFLSSEMIKISLSCRLISNVHCCSVTTVWYALTEEFYMNREVNNFTQQILKHFSLDSRLSILLLHLSSLFSTSRSPSQLLFLPLLSASLSCIFLYYWQDRVPMIYLWLYPSRLRAQTVSGIIQHGSCNAQVSTRLRPPRLADKLKDNESEALGSCREKYSWECGEKNNIALTTVDGRSKGMESSVQLQVSWLMWNIQSTVLVYIKDHSSQI